MLDDKREEPTDYDGRTPEIDGARNTKHNLVILGFLAALVPLLYTLYTNHIWEDFFITFRCSRNLAEGNGLVYQIGERVHVFTSPLGVLLPALCHLLTDSKGYLGALWLFRVVFCVPAFVFGAIFVIKSFSESKNCSQFAPILFIALFYIFDVKSVMFSMNGMETAFMLFFLAWGILLMFRGIRRNWLLTGICWAGLMWTRPDSCFFIASLMAATFAYAPSGEKRDTFTAMIKGACVTTLLYLPWFIGAWWYYGSPVPNTVLAKSAMNSFSLSRAFLDLPAHAAWAFAPVYPTFAKWPAAVSIFTYLIAGFSFIYWMLPIKDKFGKPLSFIFFLLTLYFALMQFPCSWYYPPFAMVGCMALIAGTWHLFSKIKRGALFATTLYIVIFLNIGMVFALSTYQMKMQQKIIETGIRTNVGYWLKENISPGDTIFLECLGYIGYFSEGRMLDYPGLATPRSAKLIRERNLNFGELLLALEPDWAILRPYEAEPLMKKRKFRENYTYIAHFSAKKPLEKAGFIPGIGYLQHDAVFIIFKRRKKTRNN